MNREDIIHEIAKIVEEDALHGNERLQDLDGWDSIAVMSFIATVDEKLGRTLPGASITECRTVNDLVDLCLK